jgi:hypothetical protein
VVETPTFHRIPAVSPASVRREISMYATSFPPMLSMSCLSVAAELSSLNLELQAQSLAVGASPTSSPLAPVYRSTSVKTAPAHRSRPVTPPTSAQIWYQEYHSLQPEVEASKTGSIQRHSRSLLTQDTPTLHATSAVARTSGRPILPSPSASWLSERTELQFRSERFNLFNRAQYGQPLADLSASTFRADYQHSQYGAGRDWNTTPGPVRATR